jgi:hypothetical protein
MEAVKSKLDLIRERAAAMTRAPSVEADPDDFRVLRWYETICRDRSRLGEAIQYFHSAIANARPHITAVGHLEQLLAETPGLKHYYEGILVDAQQIRRWLEEVQEVEIARKTKWFMYSPEAARIYGNDLKITEIGKLVKAEDDIAGLAMEIRHIANVENQLLSVIEGFTIRNINLNRIVDVRKANLQEVWVDPRKETRNV